MGLMPQKYPRAKTNVWFFCMQVNRQTSGESASLPQYDKGTESAEVATSGMKVREVRVWLTTAI